MTGTRWLVLAVLAIVAVTAVVLSRRGAAGTAVDTVTATRQARSPGSTRWLPDQACGSAFVP